MNARWLLILLAAISARSAIAADEVPPTLLKLASAAEPVPSLKYRLLPELRDQTPGNAIMGYYRAFSPEWQIHRRDVQLENGPFYKALDLSLEELRGSEVAKQLAWLKSWPMIGEIDRAARHSYCDWELTERMREEGINMQLPDVQGMREFGMMLAVRARLELADGKFDAAARTLQTGYAMARHAGEGPTLIHGLVGLAIAANMNKQIETWVQTPGSPNLYWALTDLPTPFIDLQKCLQGERIILDNLLPQMRESLKDPAMPPFPLDPMRKALEKIAEVAQIESNEIMPFDLLFVAAKYPGAKQFLARHGWTAAQIEAMTSIQAVLMQELFEYDRLFDLITRAASLPYLQGHAAMQDAEEQIKKATQVFVLQGPALAKLLLPATSRVLAARTQRDRQIAALRTIEAIRMYAAANGKLPAKLEAITAVPLPLDPVTGKAFPYTLAGGKATLIATIMPEDSMRNPIRYEITIAK